ncbi:hypothetical protein J1N35_038419 [Gossypium stocksii]|uniref:Uncharacterized protein n=1 Tax=Gossypium stocksii TaxID=47602 RepID=A0A9D3ULU2_9ROSI|nr:hypothetical protein J1N35_038419 [Gossypium stocksii]
MYRGGDSSFTVGAGSSASTQFCEHYKKCHVFYTGPQNIGSGSVLNDFEIGIAENVLMFRVEHKLENVSVYSNPCMGFNRGLFIVSVNCEHSCTCIK